MKVFVAGHSGMVGGALVRHLRARQRAGERLTILTRSRTELDLTDQAATRAFLQDARPDAILLAAARVGGIMANRNAPAAFIYENLMIAANVIHEAHNAGVQRLVQLGSSAIYPLQSPQPMPESALLTGPLEATHEPYATAKIATIKLCESYNRQYSRDYRTAIPTNLYGPSDNFDPETAHVLPALLRRFHDAAVEQREEVVLWGTGSPRREFLHVDDLAEAVLFLLDLEQSTYNSLTSPQQSHVNVGTGRDISILELAQMVAELVGYSGRIATDPSKPDGTPRKLMNVDLLAEMGWKSRVSLRQGLRETYAWFQAKETGAIRGI